MRLSATLKSCAPKKGVNLRVPVRVDTGEVVVRSIRTGEGHAEYTPSGPLQRINGVQAARHQPSAPQAGSVH